MKLKKLFFLAAIALSYTSCSDHIFDQEKVEVPFEQKVSILSRQNISTEYVPSDEPNRYNATVRWPKYDGIVTFKDSNQRRLNEFAITTNEFTVQNLEGGKETLVIMETTSSSKYSRNQIELLLLPPKDIVFSNSISLQEDTRFIAERMFISDGVKIYTNEFNLNLKFKKLIVGSGVEVSNFQPENISSSEGKNGGSIEISGDEAIGYLTFKINSQKGADGEVGFPRCLGTHAEEIFYDCYGSSGKSSGKRGSVSLQLNNSENFDFRYEFSDIPGGLAGNKNPNLNAHDRTMICLDWLKLYDHTPATAERYKKCDQPSKNGEPGYGGILCRRLSKEDSYECIQKD